MNLDIRPEEIDYLLANLDNLSVEEQAETLQILETLEARAAAQRAHDDLIEFCKQIWPDYKVGAHHRLLAKILMAVERGEKDRVTVSIAPRFGKSMLVSTAFPAWYIGRNPTKKIIITSHKADLAVDFGRQVRNIVGSDKFKAIFPGVSLAVDSKSAGRWNTNHGGVFNAIGTGGAIAGIGGDIILADDIMSEQDILSGGPDVLQKIYHWFAYGLRTRLMPKGRMVVVGTRWHQEDVIGRVIKEGAMNPEADQYEVVEFPAIIEQKEVDPETGVERLVEKSLWPEQFTLEELKRTRATMPAFQWNAQYMQNPTAESGSIIKREDWRTWPKDDPPECDYIIMSLDAAAEAHNRADFTALTTWGVFTCSDPNITGCPTPMQYLILLNSIKTRVEFPELKALAKREYMAWKPDTFIVEKKSSGTPLYQELRRTGMVVSEYTPVRGTTNNPNNKMARLNSVADIVRSGIVWVPRTRWAEELIEEIAAFPFGSHDDLVDSTIQVLLYFRQGGFGRLPSDEFDDDKPRVRRGHFY